MEASQYHQHKSGYGLGCGLGYYELITCNLADEGRNRVRCELVCS